MIKIRSLLPEFFIFWNQAQHKEIHEQEAIWRGFYEFRNPEIFDLYFSGFASRKRLPEALTRYRGKTQQLKATEQKIVDLIHGIIPKAMKLFEARDEEIDLDIVIMVGAYGADGFTTDLQGKPTVFFAVEVLSEYEIERTQVLIAHELCHGIHGELLRNAHPEIISVMDKKEFQGWIAKGAFMEGLAICGSKKLLPGFGEHLYLFYSREQGDWCQKNRKKLIELILNDLGKRDGSAFDRYFWSNKSKTDLPYTRTGYYVGYLAIEHLLKQYSLKTLAELGPEEYPKLIRMALAKGG